MTESGEHQSWTMPMKPKGRMDIEGNSQLVCGSTPLRLTATVNEYGEPAILIDVDEEAQGERIGKMEEALNRILQAADSAFERDADPEEDRMLLQKIAITAQEAGGESSSQLESS